MRIDKVALFTNEYPPNVYGGAGVHVEYLGKALSEFVEVEVRCFGDQEIDTPALRVRGYRPWEEIAHNTDTRFIPAMDALSRSLAIAKDTLDADIVHSHTWYTQLAGLLAGKLWEVPTVLTTHSLEPLRPWKAEQLGSAYELSRWIEKTAIESVDTVIAVSEETRRDVLAHFEVDAERVRVVHNGIDLTEYHPTEGIDTLKRYGVDPTRPYALFVGRITRQKGIIHLVEAIPGIDPSIQIVLLAGAPDTPEIAHEMKTRVAAMRAQRDGIVWVDEMVPREDTIRFYTHARVFCCPSVYEPFGIINLEAMACETPVVASAVGGIPEVVVHDETGLLVDLELHKNSFEPVDPQGFSRSLAAAINTVATNEPLARRMGLAGRARVEAEFSWRTIAKRTLDLYESLVE